MGNNANNTNTTLLKHEIPDDETVLKEQLVGPLLGCGGVLTTTTSPIGLGWGLVVKIAALLWFFCVFWPYTSSAYISVPFVEEGEVWNLCGEAEEVADGRECKQSRRLGSFPRDLPFTLPGLPISSI